MTERMFQERQKPWHMDVEQGAEIIETEYDESCIYCLSKSCDGTCPQSIEDETFGL